MSFHDSILRVMSGEACGVGPAAMRGTLALAEPIYRGIVAWRNRRFDRDPSLARRLPRPVISIGNLTTGGTGKTPVVRWLAAALRDRGRRVAILSRGYKAAPGMLGDEQRMLLAMLGGGGERGRVAEWRSGGVEAAPSETAGPPPRDPATTNSAIQIEADPDRHAAGQRVLASFPDVDLFLLDDAFQHRRLHRDLDIVLLHGREPFGFGHTLPRGMLREPPASLRRAGVVVLTNVDSSPSERIESTVAEVRRWNPTCPIVFERHQAVGFRSADVGSHAPVDHPAKDLQLARVFCFSGLGSPAGFEAQVRGLAGTYAGQRRFPDHHAYAVADLQSLQADAVAAGADLLVTTEKDWIKVAALPESHRSSPPIWRLDIEARFDNAGDAVLLEAVENVL